MLERKGLRGLVRFYELELALASLQGIANQDPGQKKPTHPGFYGLQSPSLPNRSTGSVRCKTV